MIEVSSNDIRLIAKSLSKQYFSNQLTDRKAVQKAIAFLYNHFSLPEPHIFWFQSPAALEFIWGMIIGIIPKWFVFRRINTDLYVHDPEYSEVFWQEIDQILSSTNQFSLLNKGIPRNIVNQIFEKIDSSVPLELIWNAIYLPNSSRNNLGNHEYSALLPESRYLVMSRPSMADIWLEFTNLLPHFPRPKLISGAFIHAISSISAQCAVWCPFEEVVFIVEHPIKIHTDGKRLHNENGPSIKWRDCVQSWFLNGVMVPRHLVETPACELDPAIILNTSNAEVRREMVRKVGIKRICSALNAECIDEKNGYRLLKFDMPFADGEEIHVDMNTDKIIEGSNFCCLYLEMVNPSTGMIHIEGVHPLCKTVEEALAWRNDTEERPAIIT